MKPRIGITLGDPRGIGPEVTASALALPGVRGAAEFHLIGAAGRGGGPAGIPAAASGAAGSRDPAWEGAVFEAIGTWDEGEGAGHPAAAGRLAGRAIERGIELALAGELDGLVTAPISKSALAAAGYPYPGHTEFLRDRCGVPEVTMMMAAETTPLGGALRMALLTAHIPLREVPSQLSLELVLRKVRIAAAALAAWWGMDPPRLAFAGVNPHASEGGLFGDEEARVLEPAADRLAAEGVARFIGVLPGDTVFRRCLNGDVDAVVVPYHDVGLAVLKTVAPESGVNVTAGLPFPRTSPDHGTGFDIAGRGTADPRSMAEAIALCARFCRASGEAR